ncbi:MAG: MFS transporter [Microthrixaceae bacterium]
MSGSTEVTRSGSVQGLAAVALAIVAAILPVFLLGSLSIEIHGELGYGEAAGGLILAGFFASSAIVSSRIGRLIDRVGPRMGFTASLSGTVVMQLLIAGAVRHPALLAAIAAGAGVCNATAQLSANVFVARDLPLHRQGVGFAVKQSAMPGAALVAGLALPTIALTVGWKWVFVLSSTLALVALVVVRDRLPADARSDAGQGRGQTEEGGAPLGALTTLAVAAAFSTAAAITLGGFFVESAIDAGIEPGQAGLAFAVGSLISIIVRMAVGAAADRHPGNLLGVVAVMIALGALTSALFTWRSPAMQIIGVPLAFGAGWAWPGLFNLSVVRASPDFPGRATGITQTGTYVGGAVGPILFGVIAESAGYAAAWWLAFGLGLGAAGAVLAGRSALARRGAG